MAAASALKTGINCGAYRNTGSAGSPTWVEVTLVRSATPAFPWDMVDASVRATRAKLYVKTQIDVNVQLDVRADDADAGYAALFAAAVSPLGPMDMMILDGDIATEGVMGVRANFLVSETGQSQGAGDAVYTQFDLKPTFHATLLPSSVVMGATSTPAFTAW